MGHTSLCTCHIFLLLSTFLPCTLGDSAVSVEGTAVKCAVSDFPKIIWPWEGTLRVPVVVGSCETTNNPPLTFLHDCLHSCFARMVGTTPMPRHCPPFPRFKKRAFRLVACETDAPRLARIRIPRDLSCLAKSGVTVRNVLNGCRSVVFHDWMESVFLVFSVSLVFPRSVCQPRRHAPF